MRSHTFFVSTTSLLNMVSKVRSQYSACLVLSSLKLQQITIHRIRGSFFILMRFHIWGVNQDFHGIFFCFRDAVHSAGAYASRAGWKVWYSNIICGLIEVRLPKFISETSYSFESAIKSAAWKTNVFLTLQPLKLVLVRFFQNHEHRQLQARSHWMAFGSSPSNFFPKKILLCPENFFNM